MCAFVKNYFSPPVDTPQYSRTTPRTMPMISAIVAAQNNTAARLNKLFSSDVRLIAQIKKIKDTSNSAIGNTMCFKANPDFF